MNLVPVVSDNVAFVGYDHVTRILRVRFRSGGTYDYYDVPASYTRPCSSRTPGAASGDRFAHSGTGASLPDKDPTFSGARHSG
ncbi:hypothetical protein BJ993_000873 [Nocardioides aromaticivorans]|uniref:KTSC domain-containing protein n=1 Tax=Nocardioides aromaticivorans TaxID=200618 RepID=A0A7Y9ZGE5_9ACTN|nr:KTSC domain-containing protein [Nocardioides aromaticivorans]NYI43793.1 hypothetical protein [Nocardioides aromaticivorans]